MSNSYFEVFSVELISCNLKKILHLEYFVISAKEVMFLPGFVCPSVCLFVNKITEKLMHGF